MTKFLKGRSNFEGFCKIIHWFMRTHFANRKPSNIETLIACGTTHT